ncbi:MAG: aspartate carbamoyltransferase catalytic subunit [Phycisphaerales bacterium]
MPTALHHRHLLGIAGLTRASLRDILDRAHAHADDIASGSVEPTLTGRFISTLFLEDSTRTRISFETAATRLGASLIRFDARTSSLSKGETLLDTAQTLIAGGAECLILRHASSGAVAHLAHALDASGHRAAIVNAGDGMHEHPTQALLDVYTLERRLGSVEGRLVAIVGDVLRSRVARSLTHAVQTLGGRVHHVGPRAFVREGTGAPVFHDPLEGTRGADAVCFLRIQHERVGSGGGSGRSTYLPVSAYRRLYSDAVEGLIPEGAIVMHPGPVNRGVELGIETLNDPRCVVLDQVSAGVPIRMAVLERALLEGRGNA